MDLQEILAALADPSGLTDEQLSEYRTALAEHYRSLRGGELSPEVIGTLTEISTATQTIDNTIEARETERADLEAQAAALDESVLGQAAEIVDAAAAEIQAESGATAADDVAPAPAAEADPAPAADATPEGGAPAEGGDPAPTADATPEPAVVAGGTPTPAPLSAINARQPAGTNRVPQATTRPRVIAAAGVAALTAGAEITDRMQLAQAMIEMNESLGGDYVGPAQKFRVARIHGVYDEERQLSTRNDPWENGRRIRSVTSPEAITAAGGICAPSTPLYGLEMISTTGRPVRDALASFQATRGAINWITPPTLADVVTNTNPDISGSAITTFTASDDEGGQLKPKQFVDCGDPDSAEIEPITKILEFGNLMGRTFPEEVSTWVDLAAAAFDRFAEQKLLTKIAAGSIAVTETAKVGAARDLFNYVNVACAAYRNRHRMARGAKLRALMPSWVIEAIQNDLVLAAFNEGINAREVTEADILRWFSLRGVNVTLFEDGVGAEQIFPTQGAGPLVGFAAHMIWYLFHEGAWLFLDGGTLDLGTYRDSALNEANKFQMFYESFEQAAFIGIESQKHTTELCISGGSGGTFDPADLCSDGGS